MSSIMAEAPVSGLWDEMSLEEAAFWGFEACQCNAVRAELGNTQARFLFLAKDKDD